MKEVFVDENGNEIDVLALRNDEIKQKLSTALTMLLEEKRKDEKGFKKLGYRLSVQLDACLRAYGLMSADEFVRLDYDTIEDNWYKFMDLIAYYNLYFDVVANKQLFCGFMRINNRMYSQLEKHDNDDIRSLMISINDSFIGLGFSASESGNVDSRASKMRLSAKDVGHGVISETEDRIINRQEMETPQELERKMRAILGGGKLIGGK
jgi:hypothetical protein